MAESTKHSALDRTALPAFLGYNLRRASLIFWSDFSDLCKRWGVSPAEMSVMMLLDQHESLSQVALCRTLSLKPSNMTPAIARLEAKGFVERIPELMDRRAPKIKLTTKAMDAMPEWLEAMHEEEQRLQGDLSASEKETLISLLQRIWVSRSMQE